MGYPFFTRCKVSMKNQAQIDLLFIRVRELELAVARILRLLNEWHPIEEPLLEEEPLI